MSEATQSGPVEALLARARKRIEVPERWTQGTLARDANRMPVNSIDPNACSWCTSGAVGAECAPYECTLDEAEPSRALKLLSESVGYIGSVTYNDTHTHPEVLAMFDRAIALAKERGL